MNKKIYCLLVAVLTLAGCTKIPSLSDTPFTITVKSVQSNAVWADVIPETNDFRYNFGAVSVADYEQKYHNDESMIQAKDAEDKEFWQKNLKDKISFSDAFLYNGAYFVKSVDLEPDTDYYIFAFPYDGDDNPVCKVVKQRITTMSYKPSDIEFSVCLQGSVISVVPSNNDRYYFDYETVETVVNDFGDDPELFYTYLVHKYEEYGFMPELMCQGPQDSDIADYYSITPGQQFYMVASGYDNGINSKCRVYKLTYAGPDLPGKVEPVQ